MNGIKTAAYDYLKNKGVKLNPVHENIFDIIIEHTAANNEIKKFFADTKTGTTFLFNTI